jgi:hypothetical protein
MEFPANPVGSANLREETFALVTRGILDVLFERLSFRSVPIVNGHGAAHQRSVLARICAEMRAGGRRLLWVYPGFPRSPKAGSIGHAAAAECSKIEASWPGYVELGRLPASGVLRNLYNRVVDGDTFDGKPTPEHTERERKDLRFHTDPFAGRRLIEEAVLETIAEVRTVLLGS